MNFLEYLVLECKRRLLSTYSSTNNILQEPQAAQMNCNVYQNENAFRREMSMVFLMFSVMFIIWFLLMYFCLTKTPYQQPDTHSEQEYVVEIGENNSLMSLNSNQENNARPQSEASVDGHHVDSPLSYDRNNDEDLYEEIPSTESSSFSVFSDDTRSFDTDSQITPEYTLLPSPFLDIELLLFVHNLLDRTSSSTSADDDNAQITSPRIQLIDSNVSQLDIELNLFLNLQMDSDDLPSNSSSLEVINTE
ncbi:hypothetical protein THOM_1883 [Trachipleistophora hominis]|uniref:Uncharacterized protein n=1 Tax=Trachipleistophora hominis TaxID=72359 RepID=L7JUM5_TRAHO|nr:hypothetical protein THOM_1883 [Trachipleistophora hominis]